MRNVLFLYQDKRMPSSRVRVLNLLPELAGKGLRAEAMEYPRKLPDRLRLFRRLSVYDVVVLQKKLPNPLDTLALRASAKKLVFDFDDAIYFGDDTRETHESATRLMKFKRIVRSSDLVVAGNSVLADFARQFNSRIEVLPSAVDARGVPTKDWRMRNESFVIGWVGTRRNLHHLEAISGALGRLAGTYDIQLTVLSDGALDIPAVKVVNIPWSLETQDGQIAKFDAGVMPLPKNKWTEGKCGYKALQYMAAGVPPVCSDVGVNRVIVEDGREGFVVSSTADFFDALKMLIEDRELAKELGLNARRKALEAYSIPIVSARLAEILHHV